MSFILLIIFDKNVRFWFSSLSFEIKIWLEWQLEILIYCSNRRLWKLNILELSNLPERYWDFMSYAHKISRVELFERNEKDWEVLLRMIHERWTISFSSNLSIWTWTRKKFAKNMMLRNETFFPFLFINFHISKYYAKSCKSEFFF